MGKKYSLPLFFSDDNDEDDLYGNDTVRLKTAKGGRKSRGERINCGQSTTEC